MTGSSTKIRVDRWLWFARFFKTRALASKLVAGGRVRLNSARISKPAQLVGPGDTLTFAMGNTIRVVRITLPGTRRGPAPEAQTLYDDLTPPPEPASASTKRIPNRRPTKKERRGANFPRREVLD